MQRRFNIIFKNNYTGETKEYSDAIMESGNERFTFTYGESTLFFDTNHCLVVIKMDRARSKDSEDTYYYNMKILVLTDEQIEKIWNEE